MILCRSRHQDVPSKILVITLNEGGFVWKLVYLKVSYESCMNTWGKLVGLGEVDRKAWNSIADGKRWKAWGPVTHKYSFFSHRYDRNTMIWFVDEAECPDRHRRCDLPPCWRLAIWSGMGQIWRWSCQQCEWQRYTEGEVWWYLYDTHYRAYCHIVPKVLYMSISCP